MNLQLYSQLVKLDLSNDHLLQMYYVLYYDLPAEETQVSDNISKLIEIREKIKLELRGHLFDLKNTVSRSVVANRILDFMPVFLKLDYLARNTFNDPNWEVCYNKERKNIKLYYETLYNQEISSATVEMLLRQKKNLESLPK